MNKIREIKKNKIYKITMAAIRIFIAIMFIGFLIVVCLQRFSDNKISFFDYRMFTVISGSMEPIYKIGDVLISKEVNPSMIKEGDAVSYLGRAGDFRNKVITHQVIRIEKDENGKYLFHTKGTANLVEDPVVSESQLFGVVVYKSMILSTIYKIVDTRIGFYILIIIPLLFIVGSEVLAVMLDKEEKRRENAKNNVN